MKRITLIILIVICLFTLVSCNKEGKGAYHIHIFGTHDNDCCIQVKSVIVYSSTCISATSIDGHKFKVSNGRWAIFEGECPICGGEDDGKSS